MGNPDQPPRRQEENSAPQRLESWKEIAAYLKRGVSTVQRWEKTEGLPVHRLAHDKLGTVFALKSEIDAWFSSRSQQPEQQEDTVVAAKPAYKSRLHATLAGISVVVLVAAAAYWVLRRDRKVERVPSQRVMLAVLPLANLSGGPGEEPLVEGMTEELIGQLGILDAAQLGVIARTSAMRYKGTNKDVKEIGRELGVHYVVEGSLRREGNQVRVHVQLIRVSDRTTLWAGNYDRTLQSALTLQTEIAQQIARSLSGQLVPSEKATLPRPATRNPEAHEAFLRGSYLFNKGTVEGLQGSVSEFQRAIAGDAGYAPAYAGLADSYNLLGSYGVLPAKEAFSQAEQSARKALEIDDNVAAAHNALALAAFYYDWDWVGAEKEFRRAIELNPGYSRAHHWYAWYLSLMGRHAEALEEVKRAQQLDPLSPQLNMDIGSFYYRARRFDEAIGQFQRTLRLEPNFVPAYVGLARAYSQKGLYAEARAELLRALSLSGGSREEIAALRQPDAEAGIRNLRRLSLAKLKKNGNHSHSNYAFAELYTLLGDRDQAIAWLQKAYAEHSHTLVFLKVEPVFDTLRSDPRFQELLHRVGFPQ